MTAWKGFELRVAKALGGRRTGPAGAAVSDIVGVPWSVECKYSKRGAILTKWLEQARSQSKREGKPWLLVVSRHQDRKPTVTMEFHVFLSLLREAGELPSDLVFEKEGTEK